MMFRGFFIALLLSGGFAASALAQDITLTSRDGHVRVEGQFLGFDGTFYRMDTPMGALTIESSGVLCEGPACPDLTDFVAMTTFAGPPHLMLELMPDLLAGFAKDHGYGLEIGSQSGADTTYVLSDNNGARVVAEFTLAARTQSQAFTDMMVDSADLVVSDREATLSEISIAQQVGLGKLSDPRRGKVLALDAMVALVAPGNPLAGLSLADLARIYSEQALDWSELGAPAAPIRMHVLAQDIESSLGFVARVLGPMRVGLGHSVQVHRTAAGLAASVARDPDAIGIGRMSAIGAAKPLALIGDCGFEVSATAEGLASDAYPLISPLYVYSPLRRQPPVLREFLDYTARAQSVIAARGFASPEFVEMDLEQQGRRLANAISSAGADVTIQDLQAAMGLVRGAKRLTLSFRFDGGGAVLDPPSRTSVLSLAHALEIGRFDGRQLLFIGFTDGEGGARANLDLATMRARVVRQAVLDAAPTLADGVIESDAFGMGEAMPLACDDTDWGRSLNRRVEVWVR